MQHYFLPFFPFLFFFILPWNQAISSLKSGGIQFKERCDVISMWHRDQSIHNLLPCLAFLLWSRKVAVSLLIRHKGYLLASGPIRNSSITLQTSNTSELEFFFFYLLARIYHDWLWSNTKDALCPMGSQAVIRTTAGHELQRHCSTGYALFDTYNFKKPAVAADPLTPSRCNYTVLVWKGPQFKEEN